jgi:hypothetical protein
MKKLAFQFKKPADLRERERERVDETFFRLKIF